MSRFALLFLAFVAFPLAGFPLADAMAEGVDPKDALPADLQTAQDERPQLTVQLPPGPSVRHIGLLLAEKGGFFADAGIDVTLQQSPVGQSPISHLTDGSVDLAIDILPAALRARAEGANIVHVAQVYQHATLALICQPEIDQPGKLAGENIGVWLGGWESSFYAWLSRLGLSYFASGSGVTILRQGQDAEIFLNGEADCMTSTTYLAPLQLATLGPERKRLVTYSYEELGLGVLEDSLYARADDLADPARLDAFARFYAAATRGWQALHDDPGAARKLLAGLPENADVAPALLQESLDAVSAATAEDDALTLRLDNAAYDRSVNLLLTGAPDPVLTAAPSGATSDVVFKRRRALGRLGG